jgi:hypothetical protein
MHWFAVFSTMAITVASVGYAADSPRKIKPAVVWTGIDTKQAKDFFARCCSPKDWQATWNAHRGSGNTANPPDCPEIDFDSYMVIAVFRDTSRIRISDIVEEKECIRVRYQPWGNQVVFIPDPERSTVKVVEAGRGEIHPEKPRTLSFAFAVLNKGNKAIVIEEDVQPILGKQPVWEERAKFSALQEK